MYNINAWKLFYNYFLNKQKERRKEAIKLYEKLEYRTLQKRYIHYIKTVRKNKEIKNREIDSVIKELIFIKESLPNNSDSATLVVQVGESMDPFDTQDIRVLVSWNEHKIVGNKVCTSLAKHAANDYVWKMEHQPDGKDGRKARELYNKLLDKRDVGL